MSRNFINVEEAAARWLQDPEFVAEYDALQDEFPLTSALIKARSDADMKQQDVANAMGATPNKSDRRGAR